MKPVFPLPLLALFSLALVSAVSLVFSAYDDPPISQVMAHNNDIVDALGQFVPQGASGFDACSLESSPSGVGERAIDYVSMRTVSMFPAIDDRVSADSLPSVFWEFGELHKDSVSWETSLNGTTCTSTADFEGVVQNGEIGLVFMNESMAAPIDSNPQSLPSGAAGMLNKTNGLEKLGIAMNGNVLFAYDLDVYSAVCTESSGCSCEKNALASGKKNVTFMCSNQISYAVEGSETLDVLERPANAEQWFMDNKFDNLVIAKRKFYKGEIQLNNGKIGEFSLYEFDIVEDGYGLQSITSIKNYSAINSSVFESQQNSTPSQLESENSSFSYVYEINSSYIGIGWNNLSLEIFDHFGNSFVVDKEILSRKLSAYGNISEDNESWIGGSGAELDTVRPSAQQTYGNYQIIPVVGGLIGLLVVLVSFRLARK